MSGIGGTSQIDSTTGVAISQKSSNQSAWGLPLVFVPSTTRMISVSGALTGTNVVTQCIAPSSNTNGLRILSFYTQVIQEAAGGNVAQSLVVAALTAPTDFLDKLNCFPIYRTFQNEKQSLVALGGFAPMNVIQIDIPANWGIWQIVNVTGTALTRNNMRFGFYFN